MKKTIIFKVKNTTDSFVRVDVDLEEMSRDIVHAHNLCTENDFDFVSHDVRKLVLDRECFNVTVGSAFSVLLLEKSLLDFKLRTSKENTVLEVDCGGSVESFIVFSGFDASSVPNEPKLAYSETAQTIMDTAKATLPSDFERPSVLLEVLYRADVCSYEMDVPEVFYNAMNQVSNFDMTVAEGVSEAILEIYGA